jgi:ABC-type xylose transport system permease subunit
MDKNFRKKLFIYPELQKSLIAYLMWLGVIVVVVNFIGSLIFLGQMVAILGSAEISPQYDLSQVIFQAWLRTIVSTVVLGAVVVGIFGYFSLHLSNKIAGPAVQMKAKLAAFLENNSTEEIKLRNNDYFKDLAELINKVLEKKSKDGK